MRLLFVTGIACALVAGAAAAVLLSPFTGQRLLGPPKVGIGRGR